jgi:hypothetical protein
VQTAERVCGGLRGLLDWGSGGPPCCQQRLWCGVAQGSAACAAAGGSIFCRNEAQQAELERPEGAQQPDAGSSVSCSAQPRA